MNVNAISWRPDSNFKALEATKLFKFSKVRGLRKWKVNPWETIHEFRVDCESICFWKVLSSGCSACFFLVFLVSKSPKAPKAPKAVCLVCLWRSSKNLLSCRERWGCGWAGLKSYSYRRWYLLLSSFLDSFWIHIHVSMCETDNLMYTNVFDILHRITISERCAYVWDHDKP